MSRGRHASDNQMPFLRDLSIMGLVILVVALIVFGGISFLVNVFDDDTPLATDTTTTTTTTTGSPSTTSPPTTTPTTTTTAPETTTTTVLSTVTTVRPNSEVTVLVLNSTSVSGLAARVTERLAGLGYAMTEPANHDESLDQSRIWYRRGFGAEALELAAQVPDARLERLSEDDVDLEADIVVVLGATFEE